MSKQSEQIAMPEVLLNMDKQPRRIGVELEMSGLSIDQLAAEVADYLNLKVERSSRYQYTLTGDKAGDWIVELDFQLLKKMGKEKRESGDIGNDIESLLKLFSKPLVPHELVSPPIEMQRLDEVQELIDKLRKAGAKGTSESVLNAFSMQLNPEVPNLEAATLTNYLKAFLCLYDWLYEEASINMTRRITTYVDPFPRKYVMKVLAADYQPDQKALIIDYLKDSPTRNRALDLLPLFSFIDDDLVREYTQDPLIKSRPAFHYRLPNCEIHLPDWGVHLAWNGWLQVEALANDEQRLQECCAAYLKWLQSPLWKRWLTPTKRDWRKQIRSNWLTDAK
ncbi:alpha-L-fucosidase [Aliidiomarina minuta]|uniref:Alpha-L-fucosidase n=1 Tax=Aliidiomarina minuta TaxID=880057 RepID=A0A432W579_9GAMM|nr:amidoligase family protein [Aliidiomarina minuta]RUO25223.1 alpha-L-fucosidase [Aliidiomarina minuta]